MNAVLDRKVEEIGEWLGAGSINIFGKPFGGKDTQAKKLHQRLGGAILGGGVILRNSQIPADLKERMDRGELIPSDRFKEIVMPYLSSEEFAGKPLILSSVGRVSGEEQGVVEAMEASGHPTLAVPHLEISDEESFRRLKSQSSRGRDDDTPESLALRLEEYRNKTVPVLKNYESMGLLVPVDAAHSQGPVFEAMVHALHEHIS
jgi:adenylate kinase